MEEKRLRNTIQSLWVGGEVSLFEQLSIASFISNGHDYHLYTYKNIKVPEGAVLKDANKIIPKVNIFKDKISSKSYTQFADIFRYRLLSEKGGWWCDTDTVCLKRFDFKEKYIFGWQDKNLIANGIIFSYPHSELIVNLYPAAKKIDKAVVWGETGPQLLTKTVKNMKLTCYAKEPWVFYPIHPTKIISMFEYNRRIPRKSYALHLWNEILRLARIDKNRIYPNNTIIGKLQKIYLGIS